MEHPAPRLTSRYSRRALLGGSLALLATAACSKPRATENKAGHSAPIIPASATQMKVIRNPGCGCCEAWAEAARKAGFKVQLTEEPDPAAVKRRYGVPEQLASCHTTLVGGYVVEGHVPLADVKRLLAKKPRIKGIAVPGMPLGSPGMETPDGTKQPFQVMAFDAAGKVTPFA